MPRRVVMPSFGMYTAEGTLTKWLEPAGVEVAEGRPILEIETDKATHEVVAPATGRLHHVAAEGDHVQEQELLGFILADGETAPPATAGERAGDHLAAKPARQARGLRISPGPIGATPVARRLATQHGIDLTQLVGSGPGGRIVEADVQAALALGNATRPTVPGPAGDRVPLSPMRRAIANRLRHSVAETLPCTLTREVEVDRLVAGRQELNEELGASVPYDAFFAKFLALELREHPDLNVVLDGDSLVQLEHTHIGIAVDVPGGLVAPVLRDPDTDALATLARTIRDLAERARAGALRPADLDGGSSTISNLGGHGIDAFTPILNPPQSSILGIGRIRPRGVVRDSRVVTAQTLVLSLTFDHRVADGAAAAKVLEGIDRRMNDKLYLESLG